jgi:programmed cell death 6-interacting protein
MLRASLNEVNRLESRRRKKVEALRLKAREDDVNPDLLREAARLERELPMQPLAASQFESFFDERLHKYDVDEAEVRREELEQNRLLGRVQETNNSFQAAKRGDTSSKERESALQNLENAYMSYKEILRNLDTGRKFWNDLSAITTRFRDECRNFVYARRSEAQSLEADLSDAMAGLRIQQSNQANLRQQKAAQEQQHAAPPARAVGQEPMPAPMPQRPQAQPPPVATVQSPAVQTWQEGMPIVFGGGAPAQAQQGAPQGSRAGSAVDGRWDPARGVNFGR